ncbi:hypothetical protein V8D89_013674 [Ganoderma adspersum]
MADGQCVKQLLNLPFHIPLPPANHNGESTDLLVNVILLKLPDNHIRVDTMYRELASPNRPNFPNRLRHPLPPPAAPAQAGVDVFMPAEPLKSDIYVTVNSINGRQLERALLIAICIREWCPGARATLEVVSRVTFCADMALKTSAALPLGDVRVDRDHVHEVLDDLVASDKPQWPGAD